LPSDADISNDDLDGCSGSEDEDDGAEVGLRATSDVSDDDSDDSDDDILYRLASSDAKDDSDLPETNSTTDDYYDSAEDEEEWSKQSIPNAAVNFDSVHGLPAFPFLQSDLPVDFFSKFFDNELCMWLVQQTNLYASQNKTRHSSSSSSSTTVGSMPVGV